MALLVWSGDVVVIPALVGAGTTSARNAAVWLAIRMAPGGRERRVSYV